LEKQKQLEPEKASVAQQNSVDKLRVCFKKNYRKKQAFLNWLNEQKNVACLQQTLEAKKTATKAVHASQLTLVPSPSVSGAKSAVALTAARLSSSSAIPRPKTALPSTTAKPAPKASPLAIPRPATMTRADAVTLKSLNAHTEMFVQRDNNLQVRPRFIVGVYLSFNPFCGTAHARHYQSHESKDVEKKAQKSHGFCRKFFFFPVFDCS
jgi:hypothetical protein